VEGLEVEELGRMSQHMMSFGMGLRVCWGQNLAQVMLKAAVAAVARNFDVVAPSETNERTEMKDSYVSWGCHSFYVYFCMSVFSLFESFHALMFVTDHWSCLMKIIFPASMECKLIFNPHKQ
jgi:hypothetical protein